MNCILIADSGSTKTDWILLSKGNGTLEISTTGINPVRDSQSTIACVLSDELLKQIPENCKVSEIYFYGAGCISPYKETVENLLINLFPQAKTEVESDLLGAARALCGEQPGIACILGTGSNSCLYDGNKITMNVSPLGYILGDEGSGAVLGRTLVGMLLKGVLPAYLKEEFLKKYNLTQADIIDRVYRKPMPNKFLASLVPFISEHRDDAGIHSMLVEAFRLFFNRNVKAYNHPEMPVNCVGSIAFIYKEELNEAATKEGFILGKILKQPAHEIAFFHKKSII